MRIGGFLCKAILLFKLKYNNHHAFFSILICKLVSICVNAKNNPHICEGCNIISPLNQERFNQRISKSCSLHQRTFA